MSSSTPVSPVSAFKVASRLVRPTLNTVSLKWETSHLKPNMMKVMVCLAEHPREIAVAFFFGLAILRIEPMWDRFRTGPRFVHSSFLELDLDEHVKELDKSFNVTVVR